MKPLALPLLLAGLGLGLCGPAALAQTTNSNNAAQGVTSGPAAGTPVKPNTAPYNAAGSNATAQGTNMPAAGVGAPGHPGKQGTEAGPAPKHKTSAHKQRNRSSTSG